LPLRVTTHPPGRLPAGDLVDRYCEGCGDVTTYEVPLCADGHEGDCPELVCTGCGAAVLSGVGVVAADRSDRVA
jgi:hypothetical protein